jgi:hypothetical protein
MHAPLPAPVWDHQFAGLCRPAVPWVWTGFLARGRVTLFTAMWKSGKTTLLSLLLSRRKQGGLLAGQTVFPGKSAIISEEDIDLWRPRAAQLDFGGQVCFHCQPFDGRPSPQQWQALIDQVLAEHDEYGLDLVVIDTLVSFLPGRDENRAAAVLDALLPLRALTRAGVALLILHHPRKGETLPGQAARGSGALPAFADLFLEMNFPAGDPATRRRLVTGFSRLKETPRRLLMELNADGTDYHLLPDPEAEEFQTHWHVLRMVFEDAKDKLTRRQIVRQWPRDFARPSRATLYRWLSEALRLNYIATEGTGRRADPFRYWLPEKVQQWQADPLYFLRQQEEEIRALRRKGVPPEMWRFGAEERKAE